MYTDSIEQLRGTAGARQVKVRAETALAAFTTPSVLPDHLPMPGEELA